MSLYVCHTTAAEVCQGTRYNIQQHAPPRIRSASDLHPRASTHQCQYYLHTAAAGAATLSTARSAWTWYVMYDPRGNTENIPPPTHQQQQQQRRRRYYLYSSVQILLLLSYPLLLAVRVCRADTSVTTPRTQ